MGHQRLGKLPASKQWREIVGLMANGSVSVADLSNKIVEACDVSFSKASNDPVFKEVLYLLCRMPLAAKQANLPAALAELGVKVPDNPSRTDIIVGFERAILAKAREVKSSDVGDLGVMARQAGVSALNIILGRPPPAPQLGFWDSPKGDTHRILDGMSSPDGFGELSQHFFTQLAKNNILYFMHREMPKHLGKNGLSHSIPDMGLFDQSVTHHCREASFIMRNYARDWNAKAIYQQKKTLTQRDVGKFAHIAVEKMRKEFKFRNAANGTV